MFLRFLCLLIVCTALGGAEERAATLYKRARQAQEKGDYTNAYIHANQAVALEPGNDTYWAYSQAVRTRGLTGMKIVGKAEPAEETADLLDDITAADEREVREALPPPILLGAPGIKSFNLRGESKQLFEKVCGEYGLKVIFDADYQAGSPQLFRIDNVPYQVALRALESMTGSFLVAVNEKVALVAKDTTQKRAELEPVMSVIIPFPEPLTPQEVQESARAVQSTFDMTKMAIDNGRRQVLFRDRVSRLRPAIDLFRQLMVHRAQVVTEVELVGVNHTSSSKYGVQFQSSFPFTWLGNPTPFTVPAITGTGSMATFGGGSTLFGLALTSTGLFASASRGHTTSLIHAEVRGLDGQPSQMHIGDRYPVITSGFYGNTSGDATAYRPPPTVNFEELGIVMKITPHVHGTDSVTLEIEAEFKTLTGEAENDIPVISNRKFSSKVRMNFEETAVMAGLVQDTITQSWSGIPLLAAIPALRVNDKAKDSNQLLLLIKPRLVNLPPSESLTWAVRSGSETRPLTPLD
ncbi:MAG: type II and III secretion system protein [Bryobacterales bacterium]|nr:type II and III secretion system protein [Bryobacterales bacterium]